MAINPRRTPFPLQGQGIGGGTPPTSVALDPRGLVPIDRTQPLATDGVEPQRLMERRLGSMPPSSFSGAGAGFVPVDRGRPLNLAERLTDAGPVVRHTGQQASLSAEGARRVGVAQGLGVPGDRMQRLREALARNTRRGPAHGLAGLLGRLTG